MKKVSLFIIGVLSLCSVTTSFAEELSEKQMFNGIQKDYSIEIASKDIFASLSLLAELGKEMGESTMVAWASPIGKQMPSQPVAVIKLITLTKYPVDRICPPMFIEGDGVSFEGMVHWMEQSILALDSFIMKDPKEEQIRQQCLSRIQKSLANKDNWRF